MNAPFFITGIPRSRTAWMANFFTTQTAFCLHDAMKDGWTAKSVVATFQSLRVAGYDHVGDSDSGLLLIADELVQRFPDSRWLFIRNTAKQAAESYRNYFKPGNEYPGVPADADIEAIMVQAANHYEQARFTVPDKNVKEVYLSELDQPGMMREIWQWLVPGLAWDEDRYRMLDTFRVNIIPAKISMAPVPKGVAA